MQYIGLPASDNITLPPQTKTNNHHRPSTMSQPQPQPQPPPPIPILLLKTKSSPHDGYDDYFSTNNYAPSFIPVLEHRFHAENLAHVRDLFAAGAFESSADDAETETETAEGNAPLAGAVSGRRYGGMIFTSQRAVEAFGSMLEGGDAGMSLLFSSLLSSPLSLNLCLFQGKILLSACLSVDYVRTDRRLPARRQKLTISTVIPKTKTKTKSKMNLHIPLYTVGPATARSLTSLRDKYLPAATIHGADAGNGQNLARQILVHYNAIYPPPPPSSPRSQPRPEIQSQGQMEETKPALLFLVGEQRRDIIPKTLMAPGLAETERIPVDEVVVYGTAEMGSFEGDFESALRGCLTHKHKANGEDEGVVWVVVFSPSGCEAMLRVLGLGPFSSSSSSSSGISRTISRDGGKRRVFVATIGPTTRDYLREEFGFEADVCAERPSPEGVGEGISRFLRTMKNE